MMAQLVHPLRAAAPRDIVGAADDHKGERRRQAYRDHVGCDELAKSDSGIEPAGREIDQLLARGDLLLDLGIGPAE